MRLAQILTTLQNDTLLCDNSYRAVLLDLLAEHRDLSRGEFQHKRTGQAKSGSDLDVQEAEMRDGVCIIPIGGPMGIGLGEFEKGAGCVDMDDVSAEIDEAEADDECQAIILNFDSPGGTVVGTFELCDKIMAVEKPIYAFTRGRMCSAAFAAACACDGIFATKSATVGNIGVYNTFLDMSAMAAAKGIKVKVFSSGPVKGIGVAGTSLTGEQEMFLQQSVMRSAQMFFDHVKDNRATISDADMGGQFYSGDEAVQRGFVDEVISDIGELESFLRVK